MTLYNLKLTFKDSLVKMRDLGTFTSPFDKKKSSILKRLINEGVGDSIYAFGLLTTFQLPQQVLLYKKLTPFSGSDPTKYLCLTDRSSPREWWFYYGVNIDGTGKPTHPKFTVCFVRVGISRDVSIYNLFMGYNDDTRTWIMPQSSYGYITTLSTCDPTARESVINYIGWDKYGYIHNLTLKMYTKSMRGEYRSTSKLYPPMTFELSMNTEEGTTKGMAMYNGKKGCDPVCFDGVGSLYWSYTNLQFTSYLINDKSVQVDGTKAWGWFDHQLLSVGTPYSNLGRIIMGLTEKGYTPTRWLWTTAKINDNLQYQYHTTIDKYPVQEGDVYKCSLNRYTSKKNTYSIKGHTTITQTVNYRPEIVVFNLPVEYTITYEDDDGSHSYKFSVTENELVNNTGGLVFTAGGTVNWESGGMWTNTDSGAVGLAFLEANNFHTESEGIEITNLAGNFNLSDSDIDHLKSSNPVDKGRVYFLVIFIVLLLAFLVVQLICAFRKTPTKSKWCCA